MSLDKFGAAGEPVVNSEVEWGRTYRHQRKQVQKPSIAPATSPLNMKQLWEQYQRSKELAEIRELKRKLATKPKHQKLLKGRLDPMSTSKRKYFEYMATPKKRFSPPEPKIMEKKLLPTKEPCSPRLLTLALPTKLRVLDTWKYFQYSLPMDFITRLDELLHKDRNLDPKFARCYFKTLDRRKRKINRKKRKQHKKKIKLRRAKAKEWLNNQIKTTVDLIVKFLQKEPLFSLNFKQMMLSEAILSKLKQRGDIKHKPARNTNKPYGHAVVDIVDQLSVWIDTVVRYVDVQYTESVEEIVEVSSLDELELGEGESEEEEEEEEREKPKRFSLPPLPLPDLAPLPDIMPLITEEGEGEGGSTFGTTTALEAVLGEVAAAGVSEAEEGTLGDLTSIGGDTLDMLITILSSSSPEMLEELVNPDVLPGITYKDILDRLNSLRDEVLAQEKKQRQSVLEKAMVAWATANEPDKVDKQIINKIQDTAGIISECLLKEAKTHVVTIKEDANEVWETGEESDILKSEALEATDAEASEAAPSEAAASEEAPSEAAASEAAPSEGEVTDAAPSDAEPTEEAQTTEAGESLSVDATKSLGTVPEEGESEIKSTTEPSEAAGGQEEGEGSEFGDIEGSAVGGWVVKPTESKTKLLQESQVSEVSDKDAAFTGTSKLDMTGELNVVMGESPSPELSQNVLGMTMSQVMAKQEAEKKKAMHTESISTVISQPLSTIDESGMPQPAGKPGIAGMPTTTGKAGMPGMSGVIPGHKPSKVFEHQPDTICCLTLKIWATWLLEVAHNAHAWSKWLNDIINEVKRIASIIRGEVKDSDGIPVVFYKEDWIEFSEKVDNMITSWRQYSMHVKDLTDKIVNNFRGKTVTCCPKCLEDNLIVDVTLAHSISQQLAEAMNTAGYWRRWLDSVVMETKRLTGAAIVDGESQTSSYGSMELIELHQPHAAESEESIYEIEELDPNSQF